MDWFKQKQKWERTFHIRSNQSSGRSILAVLFWLWGVVGLLFNAGTLFGLTGSIGVGTSSYLSASCLLWIGSVVLFGIGALLAHTDFDSERPTGEDGDYGDVRVTR